MSYVLAFYMTLSAVGVLTVLFETCVVCMKALRFFNGDRERETLAARHP